MATNEKDDDLRRALRSGAPIRDADFDRVYPRHVQSLSSIYWTPARVARRAAELLAPSRDTRVLDVGSGVGKFCIIAAMHTGASVTGVEHRESLVTIAREAADWYAAPARFIHGDLTTLDWCSFEAFYFYNPFFENVHRVDRIDDDVELTQRRFVSDVARALSALERAPAGTRVVTYHGLGAEMPPTYQLAASECAGSDALKLWVQSERTTGDVGAGATLALAAPLGE